MDAPDRALARVSRATLTLAALLLLAALPWRSAPQADCVFPVSAELRDGRTLAVRCDGKPGPALAGPARLLFGQRLDPNTADAASLAVLPGVGTGRAEAIVRERAQAAFVQPEDLRRVPGIGVATLARLRPWLLFALDSSTSTAPVDPAEHGD